MYVRQDQVQDELCDVIDLIQLVFTHARVRGVQDPAVVPRSEEHGEIRGDGRALGRRPSRVITERSRADEAQLLPSPWGRRRSTDRRSTSWSRTRSKRTWQLGTVQVDYVMAERFNLEYTGSDGQKHRPVIIHRAPFGSLERFIGVLIEHFAGEFPLWLAPVQAAVIPITDKPAGVCANGHGDAEVRRHSRGAGRPQREDRLQDPRLGAEEGPLHARRRGQGTPGRHGRRQGQHRKGTPGRSRCRSSSTACGPGNRHKALTL